MIQVFQFKLGRENYRGFQPRKSGSRCIATYSKAPTTVQAAIQPSTSEILGLFLSMIYFLS